ncbi:3-keto-disaccharide hydrolase [Haloferula sp.]|uniref:3-keto-disaccharide hydrolase n=1 Tax=Haloferula sp. TaxID=2497595 RepID=UPI003C71F226
MTLLRHFSLFFSRRFMLPLIAICGFQPSLADDSTSKETWIQLFNGKDLDGWTPKFKGHELGVNLHDTFKVEDGLLVIDYSKWEEFNGKFGHLFYKTPYSHYRLRATYRFVGEQVKGGPAWAIRNNGFMIHCQDPKTLAKDQDFPNSIEVQLLGGLGKGDRGTLNICTPGTQLVWDGALNKNHVIETGGPTFDGDQWVSVEIEVRGDEVIKHIVGDTVVCEYSKPQLDDGTPLTGGYISIQAESSPTEFKSIELLPLDD